MAVTLAQWAIDNRDAVPKRNGALIMMLNQISPVMRVLPMDKIDGAFYEYERVTTLPAVGWRAVNQAWSESTGVTTPYREHLKILGGEAKVDVHLLRTATQNGQGTLKRQTELKLQAAANEWERSFFEGSETSDPDELVGLRNRIAGNQLIIQASGGGTLTLAKFDQAIDAVPFSPRDAVSVGQVRQGAGIKVSAFMNRTVYTKLNALINATTGSRQIVTTRDAFGNYVERYRHVELNVVEQSGTGVTTLDYDEDPGDGTADTASIYLCAFGDGLVHGIFNNGGSGQMGPDGQEIPILIQQHQFGSLDTIGMESEPRVTLRFEGSYGMAIDHPRAASRLYGITNT